MEVMNDESSIQSSIPLNMNTSASEELIIHQTSQRKISSLSHIVRPDLDRLDQMIGKLQKCTNSTCVSPNFNQTMNGHHQSQQSIHRSHSSKCRAPPPPPTVPPVVNNSSSMFSGSTSTIHQSRISSSSSSSLPETFVSSLRQLFSILDKTNVGYVPFDVFQRYWTPSFHFENSSSRLDILHELEIESKSNNYFITFDLLLHVIERSLSNHKHLSTSNPTLSASDSSSSSSSSTPPIIVPKPTRPTVPQSYPLNRSTSIVVPPQTKKIDQREDVPIVYRSYNSGIERNYSHLHDPTSHSSRPRKKVLLQKPTKQSNPNVYAENPALITRRNTFQSNDIDFAMIRAMKRFEIERDLLVQTCETIDRVKSYLLDRLSEMKEKQHSYSIQLSNAESTGIAPETIYNRDLVADLLKLANTVLAEANVDSKKSSDRSSSSLSSSSLNGNSHQYQQQLKAKEDRIRQLETEKRVLLKELVEMRHQHRTVVPAKNS